MGDLNLKAASGGQIALTPTNTASNYTLTLPAKTGNIITSADSGTVTQAMLASNVASNGPAFSAYQSSAQSVTLNTWTKIQFQSKEFDLGTCFNNTGSTATLNGLSVPAYAFMPNVAGYYQVSGAFTNATTLTTVGLTIYKGTDPFKRVYNSVGGGATTSTASGSCLIYLDGSTNYITLYCYIGATQNAYAFADSTYFQAALVRAA